MVTLRMFSKIGPVVKVLIYYYAYTKGDSLSPYQTHNSESIDLKFWNNAYAELNFDTGETSVVHEGINLKVSNKKSRIEFYLTGTSNKRLNIV